MMMNTEAFISGDLRMTRKCFKNPLLECFVLKGKVHPNRKIQSLVLRQPKWISILYEPPSSQIDLKRCYLHP